MLCATGASPARDQGRRCAKIIELKDGPPRAGGVIVYNFALDIARTRPNEPGATTSSATGSVSRPRARLISRARPHAGRLRHHRASNPSPPRSCDTESSPTNAEAGNLDR
jgi:hypothetical protein